MSDCSQDPTSIQPTTIDQSQNIAPLLQSGVRIEFGAYGKGYGSHTRTLILSNNELHCKILNPDPLIGTKSYQIQLDSTQLPQLLEELRPQDINGTKTYHNRGVRDGGYFKVTTEAGERMFTNVFSNNGIGKNITPDTIGLYRYEKIWREAVKLTRF